MAATKCPSAARISDDIGLNNDSTNYSILSEVALTTSTESHHQVLSRCEFEVDEIEKVKEIASIYQPTVTKVPSHCILEHIWNAIRVDPDDALLWHFRGEMVEMFRADLFAELDLVEQVLRKNLDNHRIWFYRWGISVKLGTRALSRDLEFTEDILSTDSQKDHAWKYRLRVVDHHKVNDTSELEFTERILSKDARCYVAWLYRQHLVGKNEISREELEFTVPFLMADSRNEYGWYHRQWVLLEIGGWEDELKFCDERIVSDIYSQPTWNQRFFVSKRCRPQESKATRVLELDFSLRAICDKPENECPWRYFRHYYEKCEDDDKKLEALCMFSLVLEPSVRVYDKVDILVCERQYVNALDCVLHLIMRGYRPSYQMGSVIINLRQAIDSCKVNHPWSWDEILSSDFLTNVCLILSDVAPTEMDHWKHYSDSVESHTNLPWLKDEILVSEFFGSICLILQYVAPMGTYHWKWYTDKVLSSVSEEGMSFWSNVQNSVKTEGSKSKSQRKRQSRKKSKSQRKNIVRVLNV
ncbi:hypothetical protein OROGR_023353 [Orobanche gracilis]